MEIIINGNKRQVSDGYTAADLIDDMQLAGKRVAMEVNREILPRSEYAAYCFRDGDQVEVVHAIGGGNGGKAVTVLSSHDDTINP